MSVRLPAAPSVPIVHAPPQVAAELTERVASIDVLRGLVITLMIFVNDVAGAATVPGWLKHAPGNADAMTVPDVVFPAFLFIAGMSIPLAFERALARGTSRAELLRKALGRTFALLVMGVVMVNHEQMHLPADASWWSRQWGLAAFIAMCCTFVVVPSRAGRSRTVLRAVRAGGIAALVVLVLVYRNGAGAPMVLGPLFDPATATWLRHSWWGILGLIGWAYLVTALVYLAVGRRREWLLGAAVCLMLLYVAVRSDLGAQLAGRSWLAWAMPVVTAGAGVLAWINGHVSLGSTLSSLPAITMLGCCLGTILAPGSDIRSASERWRWAFTFAIGLIIAGVLLDAPYGISKIRATPSWCCYCGALTVLAWIWLSWLIDVRGGGGRLARIVAPADANPLLAYLLHPIVLLLPGLFGPAAVTWAFFYRSPQSPALVAIAGSLVMALVLVQATGWIARAGFRLKV